MKFLSPGVTTLLLATFLAGSAHGAGITVREQAAGPIGMLLAVTAHLDDPATTYYNPAGAAFLQGVQATLSTSVVVPNFTWQDPEGMHPDTGIIDPVVVMPGLYVTGQIYDEITLGLSMNVPYGLRVTYPDDWPGQALITESELVVPLITPSISFLVHENVAIAMGVLFSPAQVGLSRRFGVVDDGGTMQLGGVDIAGSAFGVGGTFGIQARLGSGLHLGVAYQSRFKLALRGGADFLTPDDVGDPSPFVDQDVKTDIVFPDVLLLGIGYQMTERLYVEIDVDFTRWSTIQELRIEFPDDASGALTDPVPLGWEDGACYRLGLSYQASPAWTLRMGGAYDESPGTQDALLVPMLPDADRFAAAAGLGWRGGPWQADVGYTYANFREREVSAEDQHAGFGQRYDNSAHVFAASVTWRGESKAP